MTVFARLRRWFIEWRDARAVARGGSRAARVREREQDGYNLACHALNTGEYTPDALYALTEGEFEQDEGLRAFDRGARRALHERGHRHPADPP